MNLRPYRHSRGFTLVELMIVVVIVSILMAVAVPAYSAYVRRSHRVEAKTALMDLAGREERYFSTSTTGANYSQTAADLGYPPGAWAAQVIGDGYYSVNVCAVGPAMAGACPPSNQTAPGYLVSATPIGSQATDTQCAFFAVDNTGKQWANDNLGNDQTAYCWNN
jgi:type IV pilus assembly protein PilE